MADEMLRGWSVLSQLVGLGLLASVAMIIAIRALEHVPVPIRIRRR